MIVVDTSVWIEYFRSRDTKIVKTLHHLLDNEFIFLPRVVYLEILNGAGRKNISTLRRVLSALPVLEIEKSTWGITEQWIEESSKKGQRFGVVDLLIAALAKENKSSTWSLDADFKRMASLDFVRLHDPGINL